MTTLKLARETWRLNSSVSHGKSQGEHTSLVSQDKSQSESDNALESLVSKSQGEWTSLVSHTKSQVSKSCEAMPKARTESLVSILQKPRYLAKVRKNVKFL